MTRYEFIRQEHPQYTYIILYLCSVMIINLVSEADRCGPFEFVEHASMVEYNNSVGGSAVLECHNSYRFSDGSKKKWFKCLNSTLWEPVQHCFSKLEMSFIYKLFF